MIEFITVVKIKLYWFQKNKNLYLIFDFLRLNSYRAVKCSEKVVLKLSEANCSFSFWSPEVSYSVTDLNFYNFWLSAYQFLWKIKCAYHDSWNKPPQFVHDVLSQTFSSPNCHQSTADTDTGLKTRMFTTSHLQCVLTCLLAYSSIAQCWRVLKYWFGGTMSFAIHLIS